MGSPKLNKKVAKAYELWQELNRVEALHLTHQQINNCLPAKKKKIQDRILSNLTTKIFNARHKWEHASRSLPLDEKVDLQALIEGRHATA